jgi:membrane-bound lytic murein transglycosylase F
LRFLTAVFLSTLLGSCSSPPSILERIIRQGELRVVTQNSPATFYWGREDPRGIEYELVRGFAERIGVDLRIYVADQFGQLLPDVATGKAHVGAAGLTVTAARSELVSFSPGYQDVQQQIIYRRGSRKPRSIGDLVGGRLHVLAGTSHVSILEHARGEVPALAWREDPDVNPEELLRRVAEGEIDYTIVDSTAYQLLRHYYPEARAAFPIGPTNTLAWALPKGAADLREQVAAYFAELEATGELTRLLNRYYFVSEKFDYVGARAFMRHWNSRLPSYRHLFEEAEIETGIDWRLLAAIAYQESHWNPKAVSPTGVRGMMMLTRRTAAMMGVEDRDAPRDSVLGGAHYLARVIDKIPERIPDPDRMWLALAAYNLGFGHVEDARIITEMQGGNPDSWEDVAEHLPLLADEAWHKRVRRGYARGSVAVGYVENIRRYFEMLQWTAAREILSGEPLRIDTGGNAI